MTTRPAPHTVEALHRDGCASLRSPWAAGLPRQLCPQISSHTLHSLLDPHRELVARPLRSVVVDLFAGIKGSSSHNLAESLVVNEVRSEGMFVRHNGLHRHPQRDSLTEQCVQ